MAVVITRSIFKFILVFHSKTIFLSLHVDLKNIIKLHELHKKIFSVIIIMLSNQEFINTPQILVFGQTYFNNNLKNILLSKF